MNDIARDEIDMVSGGKCRCKCWDDSGTSEPGNVDTDAQCKTLCTIDGLMYHQCLSYFG